MRERQRFERELQALELFPIPAFEQELAGFGLRESGSPPTVLDGKEADEIIVKLADGTRYRVRRKMRAKVLTRPGQPRLGFCMNDERVFGRVAWCEGTQARIDFGANVPAALKNLLNNVVGQINQGASPDQIKQTFENAQVQPFVELDITKVGSWKIAGDLKLGINRTGVISTTAKVSADKGWVKLGAEYTDDGTGKQVRVTADFSLGKRKVQGRKCQERELAIWWDAECLREVPANDPLPVPGFRENEETLYLYFEHAKDILRRDPKAATEPVDVIDQILRSNPKLGTALLNKRTLQRLDYLVGQGYWLDSVKGYTSPEGRSGPSLRMRGPAAKWEGNTELSRKRAEKVRKRIADRYGGMWFTKPMPPPMRFPPGKSMPSGVGLSECPKLEERPGVELEGAKLDRALIRGGVKIQCCKLDRATAQVDEKGAFVKQCPTELARMTETDRKFVTNPGISDRRRAERLFENLRRVEIHLRQREKLSDVDIPGTRLVREHNCPPEVIEAAERKWGSRIPFTKPDEPICN